MAIVSIFTLPYTAQLRRELHAIKAAHRCVRDHVAGMIQSADEMAEAFGKYTPRSVLDPATVIVELTTAVTDAIAAVNLEWTDGPLASASPDVSLNDWQHGTAAWVVGTSRFDTTLYGLVGDYNVGLPSLTGAPTDKIGVLNAHLRVSLSRWLWRLWPAYRTAKLADNYTSEAFYPFQLWNLARSCARELRRIGMSSRRWSNALTIAAGMGAAGAAVYAACDNYRMDADAPTSFLPTLYTPLPYPTEPIWSSRGDDEYPEAVAALIELALSWLNANDGGAASSSAILDSAPLVDAAVT